MSKHSKETPYTKIYSAACQFVSFVFLCTNLQILQSPQYDKLLEKKTETEWVSTGIIINPLGLLEAGCDKTPGASDIN